MITAATVQSSWLRVQETQTREGSYAEYFLIRNDGRVVVE